MHFVNLDNYTKSDPGDLNIVLFYCNRSISELPHFSKDCKQLSTVIKVQLSRVLTIRRLLFLPSIVRENLQSFPCAAESDMSVE